VNLEMADQADASSADATTDMADAVRTDGLLRRGGVVRRRTPFDLRSWPQTQSIVGKCWVFLGRGGARHWLDVIIGWVDVVNSGQLSRGRVGRDLLRQRSGTSLCRSLDLLNLSSSPGRVVLGQYIVLRSAGIRLQ